MNSGRGRGRLHIEGLLDNSGVGDEVEGVMVVVGHQPPALQLVRLVSGQSSGQILDKSRVTTMFYSYLNPKSIGVKYPLIVLEGGDIFTMPLF